MRFIDLGIELQNKLKDNFGRYGMSAEHMYDNTDFFSQEMKGLTDSEFLKMLEMKNISHIYPQSQYPDLISEPWNVFLEDEFENQSRGAQIVNQHEINAAYVDQVNDVYDLDVNDDGIIDLTPLEQDFGQSLDIDDWFFDVHEYLL